MINTLSNLLPNGADRVMMAFGGCVGAAFSFAFGDVGALIYWLGIFVVLDYVTGILCAVKNGTWSSRKLFYGTIRKFIIFAVVALSHGLDVALADLLKFQFIQSIVIVAYIAGEFGSIIENLEKTGLGNIVPPVLRHILYAINIYIDKQVDGKLGLPGETKK